jgi:hypothetical protein
MDLRHLSDDELIKNSDRSVHAEREATTVVLHHFREIERRRLFSTYKFGSLFEMAMKHFGYTEDQANSRISAMRLLQELPELEEKINSGALTLTHLNMVRTHFRNEMKYGGKNATKEEKLELITKMEKTSKREAQVFLQSVSIAPQVLPYDEIRPVSEDKILFKFVADSSVEVDVKTLKGLLAHKCRDLSLGELFKKLCELGLQEWSPAKELKNNRGRNKNLNKKDINKKGISKKNINKALHSPGPERGAQGKNQTQASVNRHVWQRDNCRCTCCGSQFALEKDHRIPRAKGGDNGAENLRVLCRSCNQRAAIEEFGLEFMDRYLN